MSKNQELHDQLARAWGRLIDDAAARRGGNPRSRQIDLAVAATASVERVSLCTHNFADFRVIEDLVEARLANRHPRSSIR